MGNTTNPCTGICKFDDGLCLSCGRLRAEKKQWKRLKKPQRKDVLVRSAQRLEALGDRAILSKKERKKIRKRAAEAKAVSNGEGNAAVVRFTPHKDTAVTSPPAQPPRSPVVDAEAAKVARKAWKKARKHARKAKKAARKARAAEARARGLSAA